MTDIIRVGEGDEAGVRSGHLEIILLGRTKSEYGNGPYSAPDRSLCGRRKERAGVSI